LDLNQFEEAYNDQEVKVWPLKDFSTFISSLHHLPIAVIGEEIKEGAGMPLSNSC
jgi:hypothetical protein